MPKVSHAVSEAIRRREAREKAKVMRHKMRIEHLEYLSRKMDIPYERFLRKDGPGVVTFECRKCGESWTQHDFTWRYNHKEKYAQLTRLCKFCYSEERWKQRQEYSLIGVEIQEEHVPDTKICASCMKEKSKDEFYRYRQSKDFLCGYCKECTSKKCSIRYKNMTPEQREAKLRNARESAKNRKRIRKNHPAPMTGVFKCPKCGLYKVRKDFFTRKENTSGLSVICRQCHARPNRKKRPSKQQKTWAATELVSSAITRERSIFDEV